LGAAEVLTPGLVAGIAGIQCHSRNRAVLRAHGLRELAAGIGILTSQRRAPWLWSRVAGDALDISSLASAFTSSGNGKARLTFATAAVAGITVLDVLCAQGLGAQESGDKSKGQTAKETRAIKAIAVERSPEEAYSFWRNFENLPRFMTYLESVRTIGDRQSHWIAKGPAGMNIEWDAELVRDEPNRLIEWRSVGGAFSNTGSVRFETAPGQRSTIVRVEMDYAPEGGVLNSVIGKILGTDIGRRVMHDLRNFKQMLEIGEVTESDASIHSGMHPAQPSGQRS